MVTVSVRWPLVWVTASGRTIVPLLPTGSEDREALGVVSIPVAILPSCQNMKIIAVQLHNINIAG